MCIYQYLFVIEIYFIYLFIYLFIFLLLIYLFVICVFLLYFFILVHIYWSVYLNYKCWLRAQVRIIFSVFLLLFIFVRLFFFLGETRVPVQILLLYCRQCWGGMNIFKALPHWLLVFLLSGKLLESFWWFPPFVF